MPSLLVTNDFPPKIGGIQQYLYELWRRLPPHETTVLTTSYVGADAWDAAQDFRVERVGAVMLPTPALARRIDTLAREVSADVIFLDPALPLGLLGPELRAAPWVVLAHGAEVTMPGHLPGTHALLSRVLRRADGVVAAGDYPAREAVLAARRPLRGIVVPPGVDPQRFRPARDADERSAARLHFGLDPDRPVVLGVSRLVPRKGFDVLIDAMSLLDLPVQLAIAGIGRDRERLVARAALAGLGRRAHFLGRVPDDDLPMLYRAADVFSMVCRDRWAGLEAEGFGIVFLEAAASGLPSVAGRSGGSHEAVIDGITGVVVDPDDVAAVHHALERYILDERARNSAGTAARAWAERECSYERRAALLEPLARGDFSVLKTLDT